MSACFHPRAFFPGRLPYHSSPLLQVSPLFLPLSGCLLCLPLLEVSDCSDPWPSHPMRCPPPPRLPWVFTMNDWSQGTEYEEMAKAAVRSGIEVGGQGAKRVYL